MSYRPNSTAAAVTLALCLAALPAAAMEAGSFSMGGASRSYLLGRPADANGPLPTVILLAGGLQSAEDAWRQTSLPDLIEPEASPWSHPIRPTATGTTDVRGSSSATRA